MTRASLLHILDHVSGISEPEVRELEQLAAAFPYCQTAHLLLAKAAHDQSSMLASQRLRRAATYAADRQLLRELLTLPPVETAALPAPPAANGGATALFQALVEEEVEIQPQETSAVEVAEELAPAAPTAVETELLTALPPEVAADAPTETVVAEATAQALPEPFAEIDETDANAPEVAPAVFEAPEPSMASVEPATPAGDGPPTALADTTPVAAEQQPDAEAADSTLEPTALHTPVEAESENLLVEFEDKSPGAEAAAEAAPGEAAEPTEAVFAETADDVAAAPDDELPAAPPIRPPAEVGSSRFEFGLAESTAPQLETHYQLPGLEEDEAAGAVSFPAFRADAELAYALLSGGSRLGHALQAADLELSQPLPDTAFFAPDALLLAYGAAHLPPPSPVVHRPHQPVLAQPAPAQSPGGPAHGRRAG